MYLIQLKVYSTARVSTVQGIPCNLPRATHHFCEAGSKDKRLDRAFSLKKSYLEKIRIVAVSRFLGNLAQVPKTDKFTVAASKADRCYFDGF